MTFTNVFHGVLDPVNRTIEGEWADVSRRRIHQQVRSSRFLMVAPYGICICILKRKRAKNPRSNPHKEHNRCFYIVAQPTMKIAARSVVYICVAKAVDEPEFKELKNRVVLEAGWPPCSNSYA